MAHKYLLNGNSASSWKFSRARSGYSQRKATIGSTEVARRAGT